MPNQEEIEIIQGLRSGGTERRRFENILWKRFSGFIHWGTAKYNLSRDDVRHAYDDAICSVITNIITGRYQLTENALLKTYAETIFHNKCVDFTGKNSKIQGTQNIEKKSLAHPQTIQDTLLEMLPDNVKNAIEEIIEKEDHNMLKECLEKLGETCKEVLQLYAGNYKDREIAEILNYSSSDVVKQTRYRCLEKLSQLYINLYQYE